MKCVIVHLLERFVTLSGLWHIAKNYWNHLTLWSLRIFSCFIVWIPDFKNVSGLLKRLCLPGQDWFYHLSLLFALCVSYFIFSNRAVSTSLSSLMAEHLSFFLLQKLLISDAEGDSILYPQWINPVYVPVCLCQKDIYNSVT